MQTVEVVGLVLVLELLLLQLLPILALHKDAGDDNGDELDIDLTDDPLDVVAKVLGFVPAVALVGVLLCHLWFGRCLVERRFLTAVWNGVRVGETFSC